MATVDLAMATDWTGGLVLSTMGMMLAWTWVKGLGLWLREMYKQSAWAKCSIVQCRSM